VKLLRPVARPQGTVQDEKSLLNDAVKRAQRLASEIPFKFSDVGSQSDVS
jgi:hypothetical protein